MEKVLEQIREIVSNELLKRGFNVNVFVNQDESGRINIETTEFQTTPVIFKSLTINNKMFSNISIQEEDFPKVPHYDFSTELNVVCNRFDGGSVSPSLITMVFRWFKNENKVHLITLL